MKLNCNKLVISALVFGACHMAHAAHPLVTEDNGTQGVDGNQIEFNTDWLKNDGARSQTTTLTLTRGVSENLDVFLNTPYALTDPKGVNDVSLGAKWRFYEAEDFSLGLKPELRLPTGNQSKELGDGRYGQALTMMAQYEKGDFTWLFNVGTEHHDFSDATRRNSQRKWINKTSVAMLYAVNDQWTLLIDTGVASHADKNISKDPQYLVLGTIYHVHDDLDLDVGYKKALNSTEVDKQIGVGVTWRFK